MRFNLQKLDHKQLESRGEKFSRSAILTDLLGFENLFVHHEILLPGSRSSSAHWHSLREEMVVVLVGNVVAHRGVDSIELQPGDFIGFKPAAEHLHFIENRSDTEARFLIICSNPPDDQVGYLLEKS